MAFVSEIEYVSLIVVVQRVGAINDKHDVSNVVFFMDRSKEFVNKNVWEDCLKPDME